MSSEDENENINAATAWGASEDSFHSSDDENDSNEDFFDNDNNKNQTANNANKKDEETTNFFLSDSDGEKSDSDSGGEKRVIKTAMEKRFQEMKKVVAKLQASIKNDDWSAIETDWDSVVKVILKAKSAQEKTFPKFYVQALVELDNKVNETLSNKEAFKAMKSKKAHFFNRVKQHWKKFLKDEKETEEKMALFRVDPDAFTNNFKPETTEETKPSDADNKDEEEEWTPEKVEKKLKELLKERGTKSYITGGVHVHIKTFRQLLSLTPTVYRQLTIRFHIVNALLDTNQGSSHLVINTWKRIYNELVTILDTLFENPHLKLVEAREDVASENVVYGHLLYSVEKLHDEYIRSLQNIDSQTQDYLMRLAHETDMLNMLQYATKYYEHIQNTSENPKSEDIVNAIAELACRQLDYLYYKHEAIGGGVEAVTIAQNQDEEVEEERPVVEAKENESGDEAATDPVEIKDEEKDAELLTPKGIAPVTNLRETVTHLSTLGNRHSQKIVKRRVMLQHVYHLALHDQYSTARDMLLMAHLPEKIHKAKTTDQILYNRVMVQLGMSAFRAGKIEDANNCLQDIIQSGKDKAKELLAQGITRYQGEKNLEQEKQERSRQIPYHMHINLDLIEFVLLVSGMLLEIPLIAQTKFKEAKRKVLSNFKKSYDFYNDRQVFIGPPESTKDSINAASKSLEKGDWKSCRDIISNLEIWKLVPNHEVVLQKITYLIQEQGLRTYLFSYAQYYDSIHVSHLAKMFELNENVTHALISNMMMSDELEASFDQISGAIVIESPDVTPLQHLALNYAEKASILLENNDQRQAWIETQGPARPTNKTQYRGPAKTEKPFIQKKKMPQTKKNIANK